MWQAYRLTLMDGRVTFADVSLCTLIFFVVWIFTSPACVFSSNYLQMNDWIQIIKWYCFQVFVWTKIDYAFGILSNEYGTMCCLMFSGICVMLSIVVATLLFSEARNRAWNHNYQATLTIPTKFIIWLNKGDHYKVPYDTTSYIESQ